MTETYYVQSASDLKTKITRIQNVIEALEEQSIQAADMSTTDSYSFDDGQISVNMSYRSPAAIANAIQRYESILNRLYNKLNGRNYALRDWRGLR